MKKQWDVIVVGAGPGGSRAAATLASEHVDVLLVDKEKFPRDKPCSDIYSGGAAEFFKKVGVYEEIVKAGFIYKETILTSPDYTALHAPNTKAFTCPRRVGDNILKNNAVRLGAEFWEDCWVNDLIVEDGQVCGVKAKYQGEFVDLHSKIVIGADGSHSWVAKRIGAFKDDQTMTFLCGRMYFKVKPTIVSMEVHFDKDFAPGFMCVSPHPGYDDTVNIGMGIQLSSYYDSGIDGEAAVRKWIETSPYGERIRGAQQISPWMGWRMSSAGLLDKIYDAGVMLVGDAGSFTKPFLLEGIEEASHSGYLAALTAIEALGEEDFGKESLSRYEKRANETLIPKLKKMQGMAQLAENQAQLNGLMKKIAANPAEFAAFL
jgi:geranylgeranyl reductase family protein